MKDNLGTWTERKGISYDGKGNQSMRTKGRRMSRSRAWEARFQEGRGAGEVTECLLWQALSGSLIEMQSNSALNGRWVINKK